VEIGAVVLDEEFKICQLACPGSIVFRNMVTG
jgi:hypothetical protein